MNQSSSLEIQEPSMIPAVSMLALRSQGEFFMVCVVPVSAQPESSDCSICTEHLVKDVVRLAGACGHTFQTLCLLAWLSGTARRNRACPTCRCELYAAPANRSSDSAVPIRTAGYIIAQRVNTEARRYSGLLAASRLVPGAFMRPRGYHEEMDLRVAHDTPLAQNFSAIDPNMIPRARRAALRLGSKEILFLTLTLTVLMRVLSPESLQQFQFLC
ncbi:hypothetical protein GT037_007482 [Alternaria burnsii]|uniref:RING-type domain-containing protein n=1 Tax=Alternaria burnsii TaxID=1187904 RepID=A0A8H7B497_9PLEO|nr:uncharacterized protein GT037_007482 [Alternaria burnsii]KAF7674722.1 hypothetical protein GT037_007482 [Alternaria burnsii]